MKKVPPGPAAAGPCRLQQWRHVVHFDKFICRWSFLAFHLGKWSFLPKIPPTNPTANNMGILYCIKPPHMVAVQLIYCAC
jgi:hypothetical protein